MKNTKAVSGPYEEYVGFYCKMIELSFISDLRKALVEGGKRFKDESDLHHYIWSVGHSVLQKKYEQNIVDNLALDEIMSEKNELPASGIS